MTDISNMSKLKSRTVTKGCKGLTIWLLSGGGITSFSDAQRNAWLWTSNWLKAQSSLIQSVLTKPIMQPECVLIRITYKASKGFKYIHITHVHLLFDLNWNVYLIKMNILCQLMKSSYIKQLSWKLGTETQNEEVEGHFCKQQISFTISLTCI